MKPIRIEARVTGCQCSCLHCCMSGRPDSCNMPLKDVERILSEMNTISNEGHFFPVFDVTNHPEWKEILSLSNKYGYPRNLLSLNGTANLTPSYLDFIKELGIVNLQLAFHGLEATHDKYVNHKGAFKSLINLIENASKAGLKFWVLIFVGNHNLNEIVELDNILSGLGLNMDKDMGHSTYQYMGRAMKRDDVRMTRETFDNMNAKVKIFPKKHHTESEWLDIVEKENEWNKTPFSIHMEKDYYDLHIDSDMDVYLTDLNPYCFIDIPNSKEGFLLGNLNEKSLKDIMERFEHKKPYYVKVLDEVTIEELAHEVGKEGNILYTYNDVPMYKWPHEYLKKVGQKLGGF